MHFIFHFYIVSLIYTSVSTPLSLPIEARDDQLLDEGDVLASGIITGDQSPENGAVQNEASILSEQPQSDISASDSVATMSDDQSANNQFARNGGRIIAYEQPTDDSSAGNEGNLFADEPSGTANLLIENAAVDDSFITSSVPSENCDNHGQQSIKSRAQSRSSCDAIHHTIDLEQIGGNEGKQGQEPHPDGLSDIEPKKTPLTRPGKKGRNLDCIKYSLGHIPLGVCGLRDPKMRHVSKFKPGGVTFWRLENPILALAGMSVCSADRELYCCYIYPTNKNEADACRTLADFKATTQHRVFW